MDLTSTLIALAIGAICRFIFTGRKGGALIGAAIVAIVLLMI